MKHHCPICGEPWHSGMCGVKPHKALDAIADVVLRYRPKPKSEPAKERRKKRRRIEKEQEKP